MISLEILEELEKAFQTDMQQKDARILGLENSIEKLDDQLKFYRL